MTKTFCDGCGKEFEACKYEWSGDEYSVTLLIKIQTFNFNTTGKDFCSNCLLKTVKSGVELLNS